MISLFLGPDDFSKRERIKSLAEKDRQEADFFYGAEQVPDLAQLTEQNLFSASRIFVIKQGIGQYDLDDRTVGQLAASKNHIIFFEEKLDKRSAQNKKLIGNKKVSLVNFVLPHGKEVNQWIERRVKDRDGKISAQAVEYLAKKIGRDEAKETKFGGKVVEVKEVYDLWQLDSEINKLLSFAQGREIEEEDVENLVATVQEGDILEIIDAIGEGKKDQTIKLLAKFLASELASDEKAKIIQFNALLADQFRSICIVQDLSAQRMPESQILEKTSWKSGRLFVMKKIAAKLQPAKVLGTLKKLEALDEELKSSSTPPKVILDLIIAQMF